MGRTEVLSGSGRVEGMEAGEKEGGNIKTGCRQAMGWREAKVEGEMENCLARKTRIMSEEDQVRLLHISHKGF